MLEIILLALKVNSVTLLKLAKYGNSILRKKTNQVLDISDKYQSLIDDMFETMYHEKGVGLAANQININLNILVLDISNILNTLNEENIIYEDKDIGQKIFFNAKIIDTKNFCIMEEGCLSIPEIRAKIKRPETITIEFQDLKGIKYKEKFSGFVSRVLQHEIDHLNGKYFTDYLSPSKKSLIQKRLMDISKKGYPSTGIVI